MESQQNASDGKTSDAGLMKTVMQILVEEVQGIKRVNESLRREISDLRGQRDKTKRRMKYMQEEMRSQREYISTMQKMMEANERTMHEMMEAVKDAQKETSLQISSLSTLFNKSWNSASTLSLQSSASGGSRTAMPQQGFLPEGLVSSSYSTFSLGSAPWTRWSASLQDTLPFLRDYDSSKLIISDISCVSHLPSQSACLMLIRVCVGNPSSS